MDFSTCLVVHKTSPLGRPVIKARKHSKQRTSNQHIVKVRNHVIRVLQLGINRRHRENQSRKATHREHEDKANGEEHGGLKSHRTLPHGRYPVEDLNAGGHRDQHGCVHEEQLSCHRHSCCIHVVSPNDEGQNCNGGGRVHHGGVAEKPLACKSWNDLTDDAKGGQNHDVHLWMSEEPEDVLVHDGVTTTCGIKEGGPEMTVCQCHGDGTSQHRHHSNQQVSRDQPCPYKHGHLHQRHVRRSHVQDGHDDVDRAHDGGSTQEVERKNT